ncbi:hypothetical protein LTS18_010580 [Coniosporium uncinatum]|uniref:Uncharacterized protein n=1 Tax=Coniosporium uncinatum TaxID=93489 RepID=A0ACC3CZA7_9PEZI|nr:hypothetical protein LTS18_010580 [Coniosporium uncinatum]
MAHLSQNESRGVTYLPVELRRKIYANLLVSTPITFSTTLESYARGAIDRPLQEGAGKRHSNSDGYHPWRLRKRTGIFRKVPASCPNLFGSPMQREQWNIDTTILRVSREEGAIAAEVLYGQNSFRFTGAFGFIALEVFLYNINPHNVSRIRRIDVHVPIWNNGRRLDNLETALIEPSLRRMRLDLLPSVPKDRLLGALENSLLALAKAEKLPNLVLSVSEDKSSSFVMEHDQATKDLNVQKTARFLKTKTKERDIWAEFAKKMPDTKITLQPELTKDNEEDKSRKTVEESLRAKAIAMGWRFRC